MPNDQAVGVAGKIGDMFGPPQPTWPISVKDFLSGPYLEPADVMLMRQRSSTFARLVRFFTGSFFSKAALVFFVPHREADFDKAFLIEATFRGIDLTDIESFCDNRKRSYVIAVKRYEANWFEQEERNLVRGFMINHVKDGYDYGALFDRFWESLGRSQFVFLRFLFGPQWAFRQLTKQRDPAKLTRFVGPGFIQWGYFQTARTLVDAELLPVTTLCDVIFRHSVTADTPADQIIDAGNATLLAVTAEDFAKSPRLAWKYAILDGEVHAVGSEAEFYRVVAVSKSKWLQRMQAGIAKAAGKPPSGGAK